MNDGAQEIIEALQRESDENYALWVSAQAREALLVEALKEIASDECMINRRAGTIETGRPQQIARKALAVVVEAEPADCAHEWADARNEVVKSGEWCPKCRAVRAGNVEAEEEA